MNKLIPNLKDKVVLDLGCVNGDNCIDFINIGARKVIGIDISSNMLEMAKNKNSHNNIQYIKMDMDQIGDINKKFDMVYNSLVIHYVKNYNLLISNIKNYLNQMGFYYSRKNTHVPLHLKRVVLGLEMKMEISYMHIYRTICIVENVK